MVNNQKRAIKCECGNVLSLTYQSREISTLNGEEIFSWRCTCGQLYFELAPKPIHINNDITSRKGVV